MEKIELIQARTFGEKLNELTALIYEHFVALMRQSWWLVLGVGVVLTAIFEYFPTNTPIGRWTSFLLTALICTLTLILFVVLVRVVGIEQRPIPNRRTFFSQALILSGRALPTLLLPLALLCLFGGFFVMLIFDSELPVGGIYTFLALLMLVVIMAAVPMLQLINVCVLEEKSGFTALSRLMRLMRHRPFPTFWYYVIIVCLSMLIPTVMEIPYLVFSAGRDIVTDEFGYAVDPTLGEQMLNFLFSLVGTCTFILYLCLVSLASLLQYGDAVEVVDNVSFLEKFNNFDNL